MRVRIATGHTDMRCGMNSLAPPAQEAFRCGPHGGDLYYVFRRKSGRAARSPGEGWVSFCCSTKGLRAIRPNLDPKPFA
ncbi:MULTISPECIES: IS66 family insertion sequence element accessory protein TnpB [unclassified Bradyrhizobium]|uniref:IS66 family insertion sequence element accessory protein TnpB n=1 Tax=Bradyrhizobium sp. USDA 4539 TaxID=2817703 RepID=UPI0035C68531